MNKIKSILNSIRFQQVVIVAVLFALVSEGVIENETSVVIANLIASILGISVIVGTIDKAATSIGGKK